MTKNIKVQYSTRYSSKHCCSVPKIQMEGKWLEELGFSVGDTIAVEYEKGSIRIRPLTAEEQMQKEQEELGTTIRKRTAELKYLQLKAEQNLSSLGMVAESDLPYSEDSSVNV